MPPPQSQILADYAVIRSFKHHSDAVLTISCVDSIHAITGGGRGDNTLVKFKMLSSAVVKRSEPVHDAGVYQLALGSKVVVSCGLDKKLNVHNIKSLQLEQSLDGHGRPICCIAVTSNSKLIASGDSEGFVKIWKRGGGKYSFVQTFKKKHIGGAQSLAFSPNGKMLASGGAYDNQIRVHSVANEFSTTHTMEGHSLQIWSISFSPDSDRLISGGRDGSIRLWNPTNGKLVKTVENAHEYGKTAENAHEFSVYTVVHSHTGDLIASGSGTDLTGTINIWDAKTLKLKFAINDAHEMWVRDLSFSPKGRLLSTSNDHSVKEIEIALRLINARRFAVLLAYLRFSEKVNSAKGGEVRKLEKARSTYVKFAGGVLQCGLTGGGSKGVLGVILSYV